MSERAWPRPLRLIRSAIDDPGARPLRAQPWSDLECILATDADLLQRLLGCPAHEVVAAVSSQPDPQAFWDIVERVLRRRARGVQSLA